MNMDSGKSYKGKNTARKLCYYALALEYLESNVGLREFCRKKQIHKCKLDYVVKKMMSDLDQGGIDSFIKEAQEIKLKQDRLSFKEMEDVYREMCAVQTAMSHLSSLLYRVQYGSR